MTIMGDWLDGDNKAKNFTDSGWVPAPGTTGIYELCPTRSVCRRTRRTRTPSSAG